MTRRPWMPDRQPGGAPEAPARGSRAHAMHCSQTSHGRRLLSCFLVPGWALRLGLALRAASGQAPCAVSAPVLSWAVGLQQPYREFESCFSKHSWGRKGIFVHEFFNTFRCCLYCVQHMQTLQPV